MENQAAPQASAPIEAPVEVAPEAGQPAPTVVQPAEVKKALRKLSLQVDGKKYEEELPFEIPDTPEAVEYMRQQLQLGKMGHNRAQYANHLEKEIKTFLDTLSKDPRKVLSDPSLNVDLKEIARQILDEEIQNSQKSPELLEKEKLERELKDLREAQAKEKKSWEEKELQRLQDQAYEQYDMQITRAIETSDLPKSPYVVKKMAEYMILGLQNGKDLSAEDVLPLVRDEIHGDIKEMFKALPDEMVEQMVGKDKLSALRKKIVAKAKAAPEAISKSVKDVGVKLDKKEANEKKATFKKIFGSF